MDKSDWENAYRIVIAEGRERLGGPPTAEELLQLSAGKLSETEAANVRERISLYPDLARVLAAPFPEAGNVVPYPRKGAAVWKISALAASVTAVAAATAIVFASLFVRVSRERDRFERMLAAPQSSIDNIIFSMDPDRGGPSPERRVSSRADYLLLIPTLAPGEPGYPDYRIELLDLSSEPPRVVWHTTGILRRSDNSFEIIVPRASLERHKYELVITGIGVGEPRELARFTFHYE